MSLEAWGDEGNVWNVRVNVFETPRFNRRKDWPPDDLVGFVAWFQGKLQTVPEQYRSAVHIGLDVGLSIYYDRPETGDEMAARLESERERREHRQEQIEANERREYERLKAKFG